MPDIKNERMDKNFENVVLDDVKQLDKNYGITKPDVNVENMLIYVGDFGRYQIILMILFSIVNIFSALHYFAQTFITVEPKNLICSSNDFWKKNFTDIEEMIMREFRLMNETLPRNGDTGCNKYYLDVTEIVIDDHETIKKSIWKFEDCKNFEYEIEFGYDSIITELNWVCKNSWKAAVGQSMYFVGSVFGTFILGIAADKWGRIIALIIAYVFGIIGNISTVLSNDIEFFAASRFVAGLATDTNFVMMYIIVMEYIKPEMRTFGLNICIGVFYCLGCSIVPWLAVVLKTWRKFLITISVAMIIVPSYYFILPESASWLLSQGKSDEALDCYFRIAKINGKVINEDVVKRFKEVHNRIEKPSQASIYELFKTPKLRRKISILIFKTMTLTLCYDAISRNVQSNGASPFLLFSFGSMTILPACIIILLVQDKIGRKALFFIAVLLSSILTTTCGLINAFIKDTNSLSKEAIIYISIGLSVTARLCVVIAFNSGSQYAAELIPTVIRGRGVALIHVIGYAASFLSPLLLYLSRFWLPLPDLVLGLLCLISACATISLPETLGRILPVTIEDGEKFGENDKTWDFINFFCLLINAKNTYDLDDVRSDEEKKNKKNKTQPSLI